MTACRTMGDRLQGVIAAWLLPLHERRDAARASGEMLALYRSGKADHPGWSEQELIKLTVMSRARCDSAEADAILKRAEESFAEWPVRRELTLCDVVHYLSVTEFLSTHEDATGIQSNIARVVATCIPRDLCALRARNCEYPGPR